MAWLSSNWTGPRTKGNNLLIWLKYRVGGQIGEILLVVDLGFNVIEENEKFFYKFFYF